MPFYFGDLWCHPKSCGKNETSLPKTKQTKRKTPDASCRLQRLMISLIHDRNSATTLPWFDGKPSKNGHRFQQPGEFA